MMQVKNPIFSSASGQIDCDVDHPIYGWIPFTARADGDDVSRAVYADALAQKPAPFTPPPQPSPAAILTAERTQMQCTRRQARIVLGPDTCAALDALADDPETPWALRQTLIYAQTWQRTAPEIDEIGWALGYDDEQIDALFRAASKI